MSKTIKSFNLSFSNKNEDIAIYISDMLEQRASKKGINVTDHICSAIRFYIDNKDTINHKASLEDMKFSLEDISTLKRIFGTVEHISVPTIIPNATPTVEEPTFIEPTLEEVKPTDVAADMIRNQFFDEEEEG